MITSDAVITAINYRQMLFTFLGGLGLFLFSIKYMGDGLQMVAGDRLRYILDKYTTSPFLGVLVGIFVTSLIQSSSGTSVITIGLVGAGLLTLRQAIGIIMGANIGTTITSFIIGFNISNYALPIIFVGATFLFFTKIKKINNIGRILFGFGGIFYSLKLMSTAMAPLRHLEHFSDLTVKLSHNSILGVFIGTIFTVIVQSSSATISVLQNLYQDNLITLPATLPILFGDNIGTTITAVIAVIGANAAAKRIALTHVIFNVIGTVIFLIFLTPFLIYVEKMQTIFHLNHKMTIAFAHGSFNIINTLIQFPFISLLAYIVTKIIKEDKRDTKYSTKFLDLTLLGAPSVALGQVKQEMIVMTELALNNLKTAVKYFNTRDDKLAEEVEKAEEGLNHLDQEITKYLTILSREHLNLKEGEELGIYLDMCRDVERIGDHAYGIVKDVEYEVKKNLNFSDEAHREILNFLNITEDMIMCAINALRNGDKENAIEALDLHNRVYVYEKKVRKNHIRRLSNQSCEIHAGLNYVDLISHFTRVCDHTRNLVEKVLENRI